MRVNGQSTITALNNPITVGGGSGSGKVAFRQRQARGVWFGVSWDSSLQFRFSINHWLIFRLNLSANCEFEQVPIKQAFRYKWTWLPLNTKFQQGGTIR